MECESKVCILEKVDQKVLKWCEHVERINKGKLAKKVLRVKIDGRRGIKRPEEKEEAR